MNSRRTAITLIELLVCIGIISMLLGLALPAIQRARGSATRVKCSNQLRQMGLALHQYHDRNGSLPPGNGPARPTDALGWMVHLLPYLEQEAIFREAEAACAVQPNELMNPPHTGWTAIVPTYVCPDDPRLLTPLTNSRGFSAAYTSYIGILGIMMPNTNLVGNGVFAEEIGRRFSAISDGLSNTIMVGERPPPEQPIAGQWYSSSLAVSPDNGPNNLIVLGGLVYAEPEPCQLSKKAFAPGVISNPCDRYRLWSLHAGGANFLLADASVPYLTYDAEPLVRKMATTQGGEPLE